MNIDKDELAALRKDADSLMAMCSLLEKCRRKQESLAAELAATKERIATCWFIENRSLSLGYWLHGNPDHADGFGWTINPDRAIRFCRKIDAEWTIARLGFRGHDIVATQHMFVDSPIPHKDT